MLFGEFFELIKLYTLDLLYTALLMFFLFFFSNKFSKKCSNGCHDFSSSAHLKKRKQSFLNHRKCSYILYYRAIKLISNRVIHESGIVCRFLNKKHSLKHRLDQGISIEKTYGFKSIDDSITN
jgi:hypothetical protein